MVQHYPKDFSSVTLQKKSCNCVESKLKWFYSPEIQAEWIEHRDSGSFLW